VYVDSVMVVGCQKDIWIKHNRSSKKHDLGDMLTCSTPNNHGHKQSYKWTDSNGIIVSNSSTMKLTEEGSFTLTCAITDERSACSVLKASISGHVYGKLILNINSSKK